jgi:DNA-binding protein
MEKEDGENQLVSVKSGSTSEGGVGSKGTGRDNRGRIAKGSTGNPRGRPKGAKSKSTVLREACEQGFEQKLRKDFKKVLDSVVDAAVKGDMKAAKMIMDRVIPVQRAVDMNEMVDKNFGITISIENMETKHITVSAEEGDYEEVDGN